VGILSTSLIIVVDVLVTSFLCPASKLLSQRHFGEETYEDNALYRELPYLCLEVLRDPRIGGVDEIIIENSSASYNPCQIRLHTALSAP
jgi:hypothetical protein